MFIKAENNPQKSCPRVHTALHTRECEMVASARVLLQGISKGSVIQSLLTYSKFRIHEIQTISASIMELSETELHSLLFFIITVQFFLITSFFIKLRKTQKQTENLEQAIAHLALALETLNSKSHAELDDDGLTKMAIIGGIAGGSVGAIWGPVGVIAGSGIGSGIANLAPDALLKAKQVVRNINITSNKENRSPKKDIRSNIPFIGKRWKKE